MDVRDGLRGGDLVGTRCVRIYTSARVRVVMNAMRRFFWYCRPLLLVCCVRERFEIYWTTLGVLYTCVR